MVFWCRISRSRLDCLSYQWKRWYFQVSGINLANYISGGTTIRAWQKPNSPFSRRPAEMYETVRFFAAPVLAKPKPVEKDSHGPRINNQITAEFVRLVTDEGHAVVSKREALERARKLKLDLVEVQRTAKPPVCKIMDFHKEKYKQQLKEKDRSKGKSEVTLRKGDCKEVRFSGKTEQKDLQMKADTVKRLMERGYRVKCMAMGTEDQDLGGLLSRLSALIEDVSIVESGPRVEKRQAYVIVRHIKFGLSKKGPGKKAAKVVEATSTDVQKAATSPPTINSSSPIPSPLYIEDYKPAESGLETEVEIITDLADLSIDTPMEMPGGYIEQNKVAWSTFDASDDFEKVFDFNNEENGVASSPTDAHMDSSVETVFHQGNVDTTDFLCPNRVAGSVKAAVLSSPAKPSLEGEKMYSKSEPKSRFRPTKSTQSTFPENNMFSELSKFSSAQRSQVNRGSSTMDSVRLGPQLPNQGRQQQSAVNAFPSTEEKMQFGIDGSSLRNLRCRSVDGTQKQDQSRPCTQSSPASNFGIFSAPKPAAPRKEGAAMEGNRDKERSSYDSTKSQNSSRSASDPMSPTSNAESSQKPDANKPKQGGWGIFSRDTSTLNQSRISDSCKVQR